MEERWLCLRVGCWGGYVDVIDRPQRNELEENWIFGGVHLLFLGAFAELRKATICYVMSALLSVRLSAWYNSAPTGRIFMKFDIWIVSENLSRKCSLLENSVLLGLETTIHHTSAMKFYTCARKMEPFFLFIPVRVAFAPGICQYTVHLRSVVQIDGV
jgi:hypothetical protein